MGAWGNSPPYPDNLSEIDEDGDIRINDEQVYKVHMVPHLEVVNKPKKNGCQEDSEGQS